MDRGICHPSASKGPPDVVRRKQGLIRKRLGQA